MEINCSIIEDLLPKYIDGSCSDESKKLIEILVSNANIYMLI